MKSNRTDLSSTFSLSSTAPVTVKHQVGLFSHMQANHTSDYRQTTNKQLSKLPNFLFLNTDTKLSLVTAELEHSIADVKFDQFTTN